MSSWRRKAITLFPQHRPEFSRPSARLSDIFFRLTMYAQSAHAAALADPADPDAESVLRRVHGFAEWCLHQPMLWREAAIGFYEDLFAVVPWGLIVPWLSPFAAEQVRRTWALGVGGEQAPKFEELVALARRAGQEQYRTHVYSTGEVDAL